MHSSTIEGPPSAFGDDPARRLADSRQRCFDEVEQFLDALRSLTPCR